MSALTAHHTSKLWRTGTLNTALNVTVRFVSNRKGRPRLASPGNGRQADEFEGEASGASLASIAAKHGMPLRRPSLSRSPSGIVVPPQLPRAPSIAVQPVRRENAVQSGAATPADAALIDLARSCSTVRSLLATYMNNRSGLSSVSTGTVLARIAAVHEGGKGTEAGSLTKEAAFAVLLKDLRVGISSSAKTGTDARVLCSILHACGKLRGGVAPPSPSHGHGKAGTGSDASHAMRDLAELTLSLLWPLLSSCPPRALAMAAWGASRCGCRDGAFYEAVAEASRTGVCARMPKWTPPQRKGSSSSPATPAHHAGGSPFDPLELSMLGSAYAGAGAGGVAPLEHMAGWVLDAAPHMPHQSLASLTWAYSSASRGTSKADADLPHTPRTHTSGSGSDRVNLTLYGLGEEIKVRIGVASGAGAGGSFPARTSYLPPSVAITCVRALLTGGTQSSQVLPVLVRWMADSPLIHSLPSDALASLAWCTARARYEDECTPALWVAVQAAALAKVRGGEGTRTAHLTTCMWALTTSSIPCPALSTSVLSLAAARPPSFSLPSLAQAVWAGAVQGVLTAEQMGPMLEHVLDVAGEKAAARRGGTDGGDASSPDANAGELLSRDPPSAGIWRMQAQLRMALLACELAARDGPEAEAALSILRTVPPVTLAAWTSALCRAEPRVSRMQADVCRVLTSVGIGHSVEHVTKEGLCVDAWIKPDDAGSAAGVPPFPRGIAIEVNGPLHYTRAQDTGTRKHMSLQELDDAVRSSSGSRSLLPGMEHDAISALCRTLTPTLRTVRKCEWLHKLGFKVVSLSFAEWDGALSTQEKAELLAEKGVPVHRKHLSY